MIQTTEGWTRVALSTALVALLCTTACTNEAFFDDEPTEASDDEAISIAEPPSPVHVERWTQGDEIEQAFQPGPVRLDSPKPFRQVSGLMDAEDASHLQVRVPESNGEWSPWRDVEITWNEDTMYTVVVRLDEAVKSLELRGGESILAAEFTFLPEVVAPSPDASMPAPKEDDAHVGDDLATDGDDIDSHRSALAPSNLVISRSEWGAVNPGNRCYPTQSPNRMTIHHTAIPSTDGPDPATRMQGMQQAHLNNGWCDIGYHFVVSQDGRIYQGRSRSHDIGSHTGGDNSNNVGIALIGNYDVDTPPQVQMQAAAQIMEWVHQEHGVSLDRNTVKGHGERPGQGTSCPGSNLLSQLGTLVDMAASNPGEPSQPAPEPEPGGCTPTADDDLVGSVFDDFHPDATGYDGAVKMYDAGITDGCADNLFCPDCALTRSQMAVFLVRAADIDTSNPPAQSSFDDVSTGSHAFPYIEAAYDAGITQGCGDDNFCPGDEITRAQAATMIHRAQGWPDEVAADAPSFDDVPEGSTHFEAVETLKQRCVTDGCADGEFCPNEELSRGQGAAFIARAFNLEGSNPCAEPGGCSPHAKFGTENSVFADFPTDGFGYDEALLLKDYDITMGCTADKFCPHCDLTRAQVTMFIARAAELDISNPPAQSTFDDVATTAVAYPYIEAAYDAGIIAGCGGGDFCPQNDVSRAQMATMLKRALDWEPQAATPTFDDVGVDHPHFDGVEALYERCVTDGCRSAEFCPDGTVSRAHGAIFIARAFNLDGINPCAETSQGDGGPITEPDDTIDDTDDDDSGTDPDEPCDDVDPDFAPYCEEDEQDPDDWDLGDGYGEDDESGDDDDNHDSGGDDGDDQDSGGDDSNGTGSSGQDDSGQTHAEQSSCSTVGDSPLKSPLALLALMVIGWVGIRRRSPEPSEESITPIPTTGGPCR